LEDLIDNYYLSLPEPEQSVLLFLHQFFVNDMMLQHQRKFNTPFYYLDGKWFSFLDYNPKKRSIHISFVKGNEVSHPKLLSEGRKQMKIYKINPEKDININELKEVVSLFKKLY
jgi:hypothetical protein